MKKITSGPGWAFVPEEEQSKPPKSANPQSPKPKVRLEKRSGKQVTVVTGLHTYGTDRLEEIARTLKTTCGAGGTVKNGTIEIQGDKVKLIEAWFKKQQK